jgi:hypothetical protein
MFGGVGPIADAIGDPRQGLMKKENIWCTLAVKGAIDISVTVVTLSLCSEGVCVLCRRVQTRLPVHPCVDGVCLGR